MFIRLKKEDKNLALCIIKCLADYGLKKSDFSCDENEIEGIATFFDHMEGRKLYILLNKSMMSDNPHSSWIANRVEYSNAIDFCTAVEKYLKEHFV